MIKLGILSFFHKNYNYGGQLQAYALCRVVNQLLEDRGTAEQICYDVTVNDFAPIPKEAKWKRLLKASPKAKAEYIMSFVNRIIPRITINHPIADDIKTRNAAFEKFASEIPHSDKVYNHNTISETNRIYDGFITGSDQVWNPRYYNPGYFLEFADDNKYKASYAASISQNELDVYQKERYKKHLSTFNRISLRESNTDILSDVATQPVSWVLDPTLLLSADEWNEICSEPMFTEPYIFCYFLGDSKRQRKLVEQYAKQHNLKIVTLPHLLGEYRACDEKFGDTFLYDVSPADFISLIKHSEFVFTDSFHATVFSLVYKKQFIVFARKGFLSMGTRIVTLLSLFEKSERFCPDNKGIKYINNLLEIDYSKEPVKFDHMKKQSIDFLNCIINDTIINNTERI